MKRITLFSGHYGSGKTNIAVNYALKLKKSGVKTVIADLDIVNPYFRTKDSAKELEEEGIPLICSPYANTNVDFPALPAEMYTVICDKTLHAVLDVGGDDRGALALGRLRPSILLENDYEKLFVVNFYRPLSRTVEDALEILREIEAADGIPFTGIVNNSNLGKDTDGKKVEDTFQKAEELSIVCGIPLMYTSVERGLEKELTEKHGGMQFFALDLQRKYF